MCGQDCTCMGCTVAFGQQLAGLFQLWADMRNSRDESISKDIEASTNALTQLEILLDQERASPTKIFTSAGQQEIEALTIKCNLIFKALILIVQKAADREKLESRDSNDVNHERIVFTKTIGKGSSKKRIPNQEARQAGTEESAEEESDLLVGPVPDLTSTEAMGLIGNLPSDRDRLDWLKHRGEHCSVQLTWIRKSLLLYVQMGRLTCLANKYGLAVT